MQKNKNFVDLTKFQQSSWLLLKGNSLMPLRLWAGAGKLHNVHYLWQILREVFTEGSKGLSTDRQVITETALVQALRGEGQPSIRATKIHQNIDHNCPLCVSYVHYGDKCFICKYDTINF